MPAGRRQPACECQPPPAYHLRRPLGRQATAGEIPNQVVKCDDPTVEAIELSDIKIDAKI